MKSWNRMQDAVAVVLGVFAALSPMWLDTTDRAMWSLVVLGVLVALSGLAHMARPDMAMADYAMGRFRRLDVHFTLGHELRRSYAVRRGRPGWSGS